MQLAKRELTSFDHIRREIDVSALTEAEQTSSIRNVNATMQKVMATLKGSEGGDVREPNSRRALAMAQARDGGEGAGWQQTGQRCGPH